MRPEVLAVRAVNQYRRRDIVAYIGLRYYLENQVAKRDLWASDVSTYLVDKRLAPIYFHSNHYKEISSEGIVSYRTLYMPGPNEILAEAALLNECSLHPSFESSGCVYSYKFPASYSKEGIFRSYFPRYRSRHQAIADACAKLGHAVVRYTDIQKFYPSIRKELATDAWRTACDASNISPKMRELGEQILDEHFKVASESKDGLSILTGPMFSHLIANLVLFKIDKIMYERMQTNYWRYVDDIVLVGDDAKVNSEREYLKAILSDDWGLSLHEEHKDFSVDSETWLEGVNDFRDASGEKWMKLIANIKRFIVIRPEKRNELIKAFLDNGINIPVLDYSAAAMEASYLERLSDLMGRYWWMPKSISSLSVKKLVDDAISIRNVYLEKLSHLLEGNADVSGYKRKRLLPKLRFYTARLTYLALPESISALASSLREYPELQLEAAVLNAIQTNDVTSLLKFGSNAVQSAAQIFHVRKDLVNCETESLNDIEIQGAAILKLNGIEIKFPEQTPGILLEDQLHQFASGDNPLTLMKSQDTFIKELACLRGVQNTLRHQDLLEVAFDRDEHMVFDVLNQLRDSSYF
jgi:hypothetical protein